MSRLRVGLVSDTLNARHSPTALVRANYLAGRDRVVIHVRAGTFHNMAGAILILRDRRMASCTRDHCLQAIVLVVVRNKRWLMLARLADCPQCVVFEL
jgi:hypothetical protein